MNAWKLAVNAHAYSESMNVKNKCSGLEIVPQSLEHQATDIIRDQILEGDFPPGFRLIETHLAKQLNLSRSSIRTALHQLTHEGLVVQVLHKGWTVKTLTLQDTWELFTLRKVLEGFAARLAAEVMAPDKASILRNALQQLTDAVVAGNLKKIADADFALHKTIFQVSGHQRLQEQYRLVEQQIRLYILSSDALFLDLTEIIREHEQLVEAICSGDAGLAEQTAKEHSADGKMFAHHFQKIEQVNSIRASF